MLLTPRRLDESNKQVISKTTFELNLVVIFQLKLITPSVNSTLYKATFSLFDIIHSQLLRLALKFAHKQS